MNPVAFWLAGMGLLQLGHVLARLLGDATPRHGEAFGGTVAATAIGILGFAAHWATARGLRSTRPRARSVARLAAYGLVFGWVAMTEVALAASAGSVEYSASENTLAAAWHGIAWPALLLHLGNVDFAAARWPAPQVVAAALMAGLGGWIVQWLATSRPAPGVERTGASEPAIDLRRRIAAFRAQFAVSGPTRWLARALSLHLALHMILTIVNLIGLAHGAFGPRA